MTLTASVCLATRNGERYVQALLESLEAQQQTPFEVLVGDDGSNDRTVSLVEDFARSAAMPVSLQRREHPLGVAANFATLMEAASGDVIFLCDQDDVWLPDKIARMAGELERRERLLGVFCDSYLIDDQGSRLPGTLWSVIGSSRSDRLALEAGTGLLRLVSHPCVAGHALAIRREAKQLVLPLGRFCMHDMWISRLLAATRQLGALEEPLVEYRIHDDNTLGLSDARRGALSPASWRGSHQWADEMSATKELIERLDERAPGALSPADRRALLDRAAYLERRARLPARRLRRIPTIGSDVIRRRYWTYSNGWRSVGRDLLGPGS